MRCAHCSINVVQLKSVDGPNEWVHFEPGDPPYRLCRRSIATPDTIGNWMAKMFSARVSGEESHKE